MNKLGITIRREEAGPEVARDADVAVVAVGGAPSRPDIPGIAGDNVVEALTVFNGGAAIGSRVVVLGGGETAVEVALYLHDLGHQVSIVHRREALMARDVTVTDRIAYSEMIAARGMSVLTGLQVIAIDAQGVTATDSTGARQRVDADTVVTALGYQPLPSTIAQSLRAAGGAEVFEIGDGVRPARILDAVHAGYKLALRI